MKQFYFLYLLSSVFIQIKSQNLVPNPSFEDTMTCPVFPGEMSKAAHWNQCGSGSCDFFYNCASSGTAVGVPSNFAGYQQALTGKGYAGVFCYNSTATNYREYIEAKLAVPLVKGQTYYVKFSVSRGDDTTSTANAVISTNKIGVKFRTIACVSSEYYNINNFAHVCTNTIITNKIGWTLVSGTFTADSTYKYVILGNFFDNIQTSTVPNTNLPIFYTSYYYIDDVCVSLNPNKCNDLVGLSEVNSDYSIEIYPNPSSETIKIISNNSATISSIVVKNIHGEEIKIFDGIKASQITLNLESFAKGVYFLSIDFGDKTVNKRIIKN